MVTNPSGSDKHSSRSRRPCPVQDEPRFPSRTGDQAALLAGLPTTGPHGCAFFPRRDKWHFGTRRDLWRLLNDRRSPQHGFNDLHQVHRRVPAVRGAGEVSLRLSTFSAALISCRSLDPRSDLRLPDRTLKGAVGAVGRANLISELVPVILLSSDSRRDIVVFCV